MTVRAGKYSKKYSDDDLKRVVGDVPGQTEAVENIKKALVEQEQRETQELQESIAFLTEIASRGNDSDGADCFLYGGPIVLEEGQYVGALLDLVNQRTAEETDELLAGYLMWIAASNSSDIESVRQWPSGQEVRVLRGAEVEAKLCPLVEAACRGAVDGRVVHLPILTDDGYIQRTVVSSGRAARYYALLVTADPKREYLSQL